MKVIPGSLLHLFQEEGAMHAQALSWIDEDEELQVHLRTMATAIDVVWMAGKRVPDDADSQAMQGLSYRLFNHMGGSVRLALGGYMQASLLLSRDLFETAWLARYLQAHPEMIAEWREATDFKAKMKFAPQVVRNALSKHDGVPSRARDKAYWDLCNYAAHPSAEGLRLLAPPGGEPCAGPFMDRGALKFCLEGLAPPFVVSAMSLTSLIEDQDLAHDRLVGRLLMAGCEWNERFLDVPFSGEERQALVSHYGLE